MNTESQTDRINQLEIERDEAKVATDFANLRIEQLEASHAAMREALDYCRDYVQHQPYGTLFKLSFVEQALSTDAGKSLLEKYQYHLTDNQRLKGELERVCDRLQSVEAENKSRRKEIASLDEQLIEAKRAIETQYNLRQAVEKAHTALRLASEELIVCVRHGDQEDIGEAMGKIEALLQPAQKDAPEKGTK